MRKAQPPTTATPSRQTLVLLFVIGVLAGLAVQTGSLRSIDTVRRLQWTRSMWTSEPEVTDKWPEFGLRDDAGRLHAWWGPGQSLLFLPSDMLSVAVARAARVPPEYAARLQRAVVSVTFYPLVTGLCLMAAFWWLVVIGMPRSSATFGALGLLFGTTLLYWTHGAQENSLMLLCTLVSLAGTVQWITTGHQRYAAAAMTALGFTMLIRPQTFGMAAIGVAASVIAFSADVRRLSRHTLTRGIVIAASLLCGFALCERVVHYWRFHEVWGTYLGWMRTYVAAHPELPRDWPLTVPFLDGFLGQTVLRASVFLFDPLLLLLVVLLPACVDDRTISRRVTTVVAVGLLVMLLTGIVAHAKLVFWYGGNSWGPRYITVPAEMCGALAVAILTSMWRRLSRARKFAAGLFVACAIAIQFSSVMFDDSLELMNPKAGLPIVLQRFANMWDFFSAADVRTLHWIDYPSGVPHVTLFPWSAGLYLGTRFGNLALGTWLVLVAATLWTGARLVRAAMAADDDALRLRRTP